MPYHFKLETLLTLRTNLEEQAQLKFAAQQRILANHVVRLAALREDLQRISLELEERKKKRMNGAMFSLYTEGLRHKEWQIAVQGNSIEAQKQIVEQVRSELAEAVNQRKIMEKVREKDFLNFRREELRLEQLENDELSVLRYKR